MSYYYKIKCLFGFHEYVEMINPVTLEVTKKKCMRCFKEIKY